MKQRQNTMQTVFSLSEVKSITEQFFLVSCTEKINYNDFLLLVSKLNSKQIINQLYYNDETIELDYDKIICSLFSSMLLSKSNKTSDEINSNLNSFYLDKDETLFLLTRFFSNVNKTLKNHWKLQSNHHSFDDDTPQNQKNIQNSHLISVNQLTHINPLSSNHNQLNCSIKSIKSSKSIKSVDHPSFDPNMNSDFKFKDNTCTYTLKNRTSINFTREQKLIQAILIALERTDVDICISSTTGGASSSKTIESIFTDLPLTVLVQIKKVFSVLDICSQKKQVSLEEILSLRRFKFITLRSYDVFKYILIISSNEENFYYDGEMLGFDEINEDIIIDPLKYYKVVKAIDNKLQEDYYTRSEYLIEQEKKELPFEQSVVIDKKSKKKDRGDKDKETDSNYQNQSQPSEHSSNNNNLNHNEIFSNNTALIKLISSNHEESNQYTNFLNEIMITYDTMVNHSLKSNYERLINCYELDNISYQEDYTSAIKISINHIIEYLNTKQSDFFFYYKEIEKLNFFNSNKLSYLINTIKSSEESFRDLERDFEEIFLKYHNYKSEAENAFSEETMHLIQDNQLLREQLGMKDSEEEKLLMELLEKEEKIETLRIEQDQI